MDRPTRQRMAAPELDPRAIKVFEKFAVEYGARYAEEFLYPHLRKILAVEMDDVEGIKDGYMTAKGSLLAFYCHYAFARRGKDRDELGKFARDAIERVQGTGSFDEVLKQRDGVALWNAYVAICEENRRKNNEAQNRGLIQGMLELTQEIYESDKVGSITQWMLNGIDKTRRLEPQFERMVDIRGVGPKSTSTFMRDVVYLFDYESKIEPADLIYLHPIDRWLRMMAKYVVPEAGMEGAADWIVAGKVSKYCRRAGVSGIAFNMGCTYFGQRFVREPQNFEPALKKLLTSDEFVASLSE